MDALGEPVEVEPALVGDDDLAVDDAAVGQVGQQRGDQLGEVAGERFAGTAADHELVAVPVDDRPEAVPFGLVLHARAGSSSRTWRASASRAASPADPCGDCARYAGQSAARPTRGGTWRAAVELEVGGADRTAVQSRTRSTSPSAASPSWTSPGTTWPWATASPAPCATARPPWSATPTGVTGESFFQKRAPKNLPDWIPTAHITFPSGRSADEICPTEPAAVLWAANLGASPSTPGRYAARTPTTPTNCASTWTRSRAPTSPTPSAPPTNCAPCSTSTDCAAGPRPPADAASMSSCRSSRGGPSPRSGGPPSPSAGSWSGAMPDRVTTAWWKEERGERIFVDYNQTARDRTIASAYSVRPSPHAPVSAPLRWEELDDAVPQDFDISDDAGALRRARRCARGHGRPRASAWRACWSWPARTSASTASAICPIRRSTRRCRASRSAYSRSRATTDARQATTPERRSAHGRRCRPSAPCGHRQTPLRSGTSGYSSLIRMLR